MFWIPNLIIYIINYFMFLDYLGWFKNCVDQHIDKFMFFSLHRFRIDKEEKIGNTQERKQYKCCSHSLSELEGTNLSYYYILIFRILYIYGVDIKGVLHIFSWTFFCLTRFIIILTTWSCCVVRVGWFLSLVMIILTLLIRKRRLTLRAVIMGTIRI